jgi:hypothetical protein
MTRAWRISCDAECLAERPLQLADSFVKNL